jgi:hypothetical protein
VLALAYCVSRKGRHPPKDAHGAIVSLAFSV